MQVTDHIHAVRIPFQVVTPAGPLDRFVVVYLIVGQAVWLIDAGVAGAEAAIAAYLKEIGRDIREVSALVLTHAHPDHVGAARAVREMSGCRVLAHPAARAWIEDVDLQARERPVPGFERLVGGSVPVNGLLEDGYCLAVDDGISLEVLHTPGHSQGSISLFLWEEGALFSGDAVPIPGDLPIFDDIWLSATSIRRLQRLRHLRVLLAAWDEPRFRAEAVQCLADGLAWLQRVHAAVCAARNGADADDEMAVCRRALSDLGLPPESANLLITRGFRSIR